LESQCDSSLPERAFSAMKVIKHYLRNTMTDERLSALALIYIHPQIDINIDEVIDRIDIKIDIGSSVVCRESGSRD
jgi:hypothetical protein